TAWLLVFPVVTLFLAYRAYTSERQKHERLEFLHEATGILERSRDLETGLVALLRHAREMFRAEVAEIVLFPANDMEDVLRAGVGEGDEAGLLRESKPTELDRRWAQADGPSLFPRPITHPELRDGFASRGIR